LARKLTLFILLAMLAGAVLGFALNASVKDPEQLKSWTSLLAILTDIFLRLIKMIIAPLVFATLVSGIAHMGDTAALGRIGAQSMIWFVGASIVSLLLGLLLVNLFQPGVGAFPPDALASAASKPSAVATSEFGLHEFITHLVPQSAIRAMADNEILQIVIFSAFMGVALTAIGERGKPLVRGVEALAQVMLQITDYVMRFAPFAVFAAVANAVAERGVTILATFGLFLGEFYVGLALLWALLLSALFLLAGKRSAHLIRYIREPVLLAFSTASSEAAFPRTLEALDRFGVPRRIASFVLPLGYSFNLDGSMMYCTFGTIFIAQAYGISLSWGQQLTMLFLLMITSKGMAGVPRASLVVIAATLSFFKIPEAGLVLLLAVDHFLDMGRSATNVIGNAVAGVAVASWERAMQKPNPPEIEPPHAPSHTPSHGLAGLDLEN
jgi:Na+/H+-dicarboxylate symporter